MKKIILFLTLALSGYCCHAQSFFTTSAYANSPQGVGANSIFGWGENFDRTIDVRPNPHPVYGTMMINYHTGLTLSAHSVYGGIRFYNQGYPNPYDPSTGSVMVMSIMNGNVGIGTTTPASDLSVARNGTGVSITTLGSGYFGCIALNRESATGAIFNSTGSAFQINNGNGIDKNLHVQVYSGSGSSVNPDALTISGTTGGVGINIPVAPAGYQFAVNGSAIATSMTVKLQSAWPDFVFKPEYQLPSLNEVKVYIDQNHHLPEMPSEQEVIKDGINLGEMNKLLTKKVEELTLYLIEKDKRFSEQQQQISRQQKAIEQQTSVNQTLQGQIDELKQKLIILAKASK